MTDLDDCEETLGKAAFDAFNQKRREQCGGYLHGWDELSDKEKAAWEHAAETIWRMSV